LNQLNMKQKLECQNIINFKKQTREVEVWLIQVYFILKHFVLSLFLMTHFNFRAVAVYALYYQTISQWPIIMRMAKLYLNYLKKLKKSQVNSFKCNFKINFVYLFIIKPLKRKWPVLRMEADSKRRIQMDQLFRCWFNG
jgi:hypothetical protein